MCYYEVAPDAQSHWCCLPCMCILKINGANYKQYQSGPVCAHIALLLLYIARVAACVVFRKETGGCMLRSPRLCCMPILLESRTPEELLQFGLIQSSAAADECVCGRHLLFALMIRPRRFAAGAAFICWLADCTCGLVTNILLSVANICTGDLSIFAARNVTHLC